MSSLSLGLYKESLKRAKIELLVIGTELLSGRTINSNFAFIASRLGDSGFELRKETTVGDDRKIITKALKQALSESEVVITTGGLGPTIDDITKKTAADLFVSDFYFDKRVAKDLCQRFGKDLPTLSDQATVPSGAKVLLNPVGTAPGLIFEEGTKTLILLPGVPVEMKAIFIDQVVPFLTKKFKPVIKPYWEGVTLFSLSEFQVNELLSELKKKYRDIDFGIYPSAGFLSIRLILYDSDARRARKRLKDVLRIVRKRFGNNMLTTSNSLLEEEVRDQFVKRGWTLSLAESCTGGEIAARLTKIAGASEYFSGGVVCYSNRLKEDILGVQRDTITKNGAVSRETVAEMAEGMLKISSTTYSLAVSGIAGPGGGSVAKPVGTVWLAICKKDKTLYCWRERFHGPREMIITLSANTLLGKLLLMVGR